VAGKVTGPGNGPPGNIPVGGPEDSRPIAEGRAPFADKLKSGEAASVSGAVGTSAAAAPSGVADLAAALKAGKLTPKAAVDQVIDRVVEKQLGTRAPAAAREKLRAALETAVADDPLLAEKIRTLT
jgi:hypothetical protein